MMVRSRRSLGPNATRPMTAISVPIEIPKTKWRHRDATLRRATIRMLITIKPARRIPPEGLWVRLFKPPAHPGRIAKLISERMVTLAGRRTSVNRWVELDVTSAIRAWLRDPDSNRGLLAECQGCRFQGEAPEDGPDASKPLLDVVVNVRGQNHARSKRSYDLMTPRKHGRTDCRRGGEKCCRHQMEVVFHELKGFEFILQPKKFDAGFCKGRCPPRFNPAHHHALIQSLIWKQNRKLAPKPCCAPNKLKSLEILHLDEDDPTRLKVSHWEDMEVLECACS
ncbi:bone morphogenetic protein 4 isoform X2 [Hetaerina americana]